MCFANQLHFVSLAPCSNATAHGAPADGPLGTNLDENHGLININQVILISWSIVHISSEFHAQGQLSKDNSSKDKLASTEDQGMKKEPASQGWVLFDGVKWVHRIIKCLLFLYTVVDGIGSHQSAVQVTGKRHDEMMNADKAIGVASEGQS